MGASSLILLLGCAASGASCSTCPARTGGVRPPSNTTTAADLDGFATAASEGHRCVLSADESLSRVL